MAMEQPLSGTPLSQIDALNSINARVAPEADDTTAVPDPVAAADAITDQKRAEELMTQQQAAMRAQLQAMQQPQTTVTTGRVNTPDGRQGRPRTGPGGVSEEEYNRISGRGATNSWESKVISSSKDFLGTPYVWAGESSLGVDCSGFVMLAMRRVGVDLPHFSAAMGRMGSAVSRNKLKVGDLVFSDYSSRNQGADHVGIYIGNGKVIEAIRGAGVHIASLGSGMWTGSWWARRVRPSGSGTSGSGPRPRFAV